MNQIPSVDLRDFLSDNEQTKSMFVQTIGKAFQEIGFCAVRGHFLDDDLVNRLYSHCLLYTSPSPRDWTISRMPSSA